MDDGRQPGLTEGNEAPNQGAGRSPMLSSSGSTGETASGVNQRDRPGRGLTIIDAVANAKTKSGWRPPPSADYPAPRDQTSATGIR